MSGGLEWRCMLVEMEGLEMLRICAHETRMVQRCLLYGEGSSVVVTWLSEKCKLTEWMALRKC